MKTVVMKKCLGDNLCLSKYEYYNLKRKKTEVPKPGDFEWVLSSSGCSATCGSGKYADKVKFQNSMYKFQRYS